MTNNKTSQDKNVNSISEQTRKHEFYNTLEFVAYAAFNISYMLDVLKGVPVFDGETSNNVNELAYEYEDKKIFDTIPEPSVKTEPSNEMFKKKTFSAKSYGKSFASKLPDWSINIISNDKSKDDKENITTEYDSDNSNMGGDGKGDEHEFGEGDLNDYRLSVEPFDGESTTEDRNVGNADILFGLL